MRDYRGGAFLAHALGDASHVDECHVGRRVLLWHEQRRQLVQAFVGHLDDSQIRLSPGVAADMGMLVRQCVEEGRLARAGQTGDSYLHTSGLWSVVSDPEC